MKTQIYVDKEVEKLFREKIFDAPYIPTVDQLLKPLRDHYHIFIGIYGKEYYIKKENSKMNNDVFMGGSGYKSDIDALNAALKYVLENLI